MSKRVFSRVLLALLAASLLAASDLLSPREASFADVGELPEPGGLVTPGDKTDEIRMKSESVLFSVRPNDGTFPQEEAEYYAHVTADFVMENPTSKAVSKDLFFPFHSWFDLPMYQDPANAVMRQAANEKVLIDGKGVQTRYAELAISPKEGMVAVEFPVTFPAGSETAIRVEYDVRAVHEPKTPSLSFEYMMQTGSHWAGTIGSGQVVFEFWQPVDSESVFSGVNEFFQVRDGRLEWDFADLEPTPENDITVTFEPTALEAWAARPPYVKEIQASAPPATGIPDVDCLRAACDLPGGSWHPSTAYLLDATSVERGWVVEQAKGSGEAWLQIDLDREHTVAGVLILTGVHEQLWRRDSEAQVVYDTYRRPKTVAAALSDGTERSVPLEDTPAEWQMIPLPGIPTSSIRLSFPDSYPGTFKGDAYLGIGRIQLIGVDAGSGGLGTCTGPNLLRNGDFEEGFDERGAGLGWNPFNSGEGASYGFGADRWSRAVYEGGFSQLIRIASYTGPVAPDRSAGIFRVVIGLEEGAEYELSLAGLLREEAAHPDEDPYRYRVQWALAEGDADWTQVADWQDVPWDTLYLRTEPGEFSNYITRVLAPGDSATLFIRAWKKWATPGRELDVNLDAIALRRCEPVPTCQAWDLAHDLRAYPNQENPNRDSYGHAGVWHFMQGIAGQQDPGSYRPLPSFTAHTFGIWGLEQWTAVQPGPGDNTLPAVGINTTHLAQTYSTLTWPASAVRVHPADNPVIVGWQSPISGRVRISGIVRDMDPNCGNGVLWSIDQGTTTLASGSLGNGEVHDWAEGEDGTRLRSVAVNKGDFLYFIVDPNGEAGCDSTELAIRIESAGCPAGTTPATGERVSGPVAGWNVYYVGQIGGAAHAAAVLDDRAYMSLGPRLLTLDVTNSAAPALLGQTAPLPGVARGVALWPPDYALVAVETAGLSVVRISDSAHPYQVARLPLEGSAVAVAVDRDRAYVASDGLRVVSFSPPDQLMLLGSLDLPGGWARDVAVQDEYAYVADGPAGLRVIDIRQPHNPTEIGFYETNGEANGVAVSGHHAFVAVAGDGLRVVDVSDPAHPVEVGFLAAPADDVALARGYAFLANCGAGMCVVDVHDPSQPVQVGSVAVPSQAVAVAGRYIYTVSEPHGLRVVDAANPANPVVTGGYDTPGAAWDVTPAGRYAYQTGWDAGLRALDVSDPAHPREAGSLEGPAHIRVAMSGSYAYAAAGWGGLRVIDVSDPAYPAEVGSLVTPGHAEQVTVVGSYAYIADAEEGLRVVDVSDPAKPAEVGFCDTPGYAVAAAVDEGYAFVADTQGGLRVVDVRHPENPVEVGSSTTPGDAWDVAVSEGYAYVASYTAGVSVFGVTDPKHPALVSLYDTPWAATGLALEGDTLYVADGFSGLRVLDVSEPAAPAEVGFYDTPGGAFGVALDGGYAYVADFAGGAWILRYVASPEEE